jgi:hypothetical protein
MNTANNLTAHPALQQSLPEDSVAAPGQPEVGADSLPAARRDSEPRELARRCAWHAQHSSWWNSSYNP